MGTAQSSIASSETPDSHQTEEDFQPREIHLQNSSDPSSVLGTTLRIGTTSSEGTVDVDIPASSEGEQSVGNGAGGCERNDVDKQEESVDGGSGGHVIRGGETLDEQDTNGETREERLERKRAEMETFYSEVVSKREARTKALDEIAKKMRRMEKMEEELEKEREEKATLELHCRALKEVNKITKEMLRIRETQVSDLKSRLKDVEKKLLESPEEIKVEYEKQMSNYKKLRELYEQRALAAELEHKTMIEKELAKNALLEAKLREIQEEIQAQLEKYKENKKQILEMEKNIQLKDDEIHNLNENLTSSLAENHILNSQMTLVNNLFSNMLVNPMINLDLLIKLIQDNYLLIIDLVNNHEINDTVSLLVDLEKKIDQEAIALQNRKLKQLEDCESASCSTTVDDVGSEETSTSKDSNSVGCHEHSTSSEHELSTNSKQTESDDSPSVDKSHLQKEIANNLPKVWKILIELLNTHQEQYENNEVNENFESCYKNVTTTSGKTTQVISVSQTFIRLKHLILEKNHLTNQLAKLKTLNNHLEIRLNHSEQRLNTVTSELKKTWNVVNKLKLQHKQLYTHEKILKYELKHKRNIINDLKIDLEYVREKWDLVKEKNEQNEMDYKVLRKEFAMRRLQYDGGRSTSESGISTDTEDDNVEIVETNDESEDDKSEVVETQSEHDVPCTSSVMSIEEEDDQDEVEELENETNANDTSEAFSESMLGTLEDRGIQRDPSPHLNIRERQDAPPVQEYVDNFSELSSRTNATALNEEGNAINILDTLPSNESQEDEARSKETEEHSRKVSCDETCSEVVLNNNKVTVKLIGGKLKIVSEHLPVETNSHIEQDPSPSKTEPGTKETSDEQCVGIETKSVVSDCTTIESTSEEQRTAKQLIRQNRIAEEAVDKESQTKECLVPVPTEELHDEQSTVNGRTNSRDCESINERPLEVRMESEPQTRDTSHTANEMQEVRSHLNGTSNSTVCEPTDKRLTESTSRSVDQLKSDVDSTTSSTVQEDPSNKRPTKTTSASSSKSSESILLPSELPTTSSEISPSRTRTPGEILEPRNSPQVPTAIASTSSEAFPVRTRTPEEILEARNARLKRLEDQTKNLFHKMTLTSQRSDTLSERLVELHDYYGTSNERHSPRRSRGDSQESEGRLSGDERRETMESQRGVTSSDLTEVETSFRAAPNSSSSSDSDSAPIDADSSQNVNENNETSSRQ
uniref:Uncharacterized protein n=1 Tax=Cacopsylla melanoneura TaxID=428564 RepID=A0A8D8ZDC0_9HEMI